MKPIFKKGQRVRRLPGGMPSKSAGMEPGKCYTVRESRPDGLKLEGVIGTYVKDFFLPMIGTALIKPTRNGQFRFVLKAPNGEIVATSETYTTKAMAKKTLRKYAPAFEVVDLTKRKNRK